MDLRRDNAPNGIPTLFNQTQQQSQPDPSVWGCFLRYHRMDKQV
jgi:hypothetical protein